MTYVHVNLKKVDSEQIKNNIMKNQCIAFWAIAERLKALIAHHN